MANNNRNQGNQDRTKDQNRDLNKNNQGQGDRDNQRGGSQRGQEKPDRGQSGMQKEGGDIERVDHRQNEDDLRGRSNNE